MESNWLIVTFIAILLTYQEIQGDPAVGFNQDVVVAADDDINSMTKPDVEDPEEKGVSESFGNEIPNDDQEDFENTDMMEALEDIGNAGAQQFSTYIPSIYRGYMNFKCNFGGALHYIQSRHSNLKHDRQFRFGCRKISSSLLNSCKWLTSNPLQRMLIAQCPIGYAVTQITSTYNIWKTDRRFSVRCCRSTSITNTCEFSSYLNVWDWSMTYTAKSSYIISGIYGHYNNIKKDRRYVVRICKYRC